MKRLIITLSMAIISVMNWQVSAEVKIVECEDELGQRSFQRSCPPGSSTVEVREYSTTTGRSKKSRAANISATLYLIPECELCADVKEFLLNRKISITEKNVKDDVQLQQELREKAGQLRVPVVIIGDKVITGYQRSNLLSALEEAGYSEEE